MERADLRAFLHQFLLQQLDPQLKLVLFLLGRLGIAGILRFYSDKAGVRVAVEQSAFFLHGDLPVQALDLLAHRQQSQLAFLPFTALFFVLRACSPRFDTLRTPRAGDAARSGLLPSRCDNPPAPLGSAPAPASARTSSIPRLRVSQTWRTHGKSRSSRRTAAAGGSLPVCAPIACSLRSVPRFHRLRRGYAKLFLEINHQLRGLPRFCGAALPSLGDSSR